MKSLEMFRSLTNQENLISNKEYLEDTIKERLFNLWYEKLSYPYDSKDKVYIEELRSGYTRLRDIQIESLINLSNLLKQNKIDFYLIKGLSFSKQIYNNYYSREDNDIDILVDDKDFERVNLLLLNNGYSSNFSEEFSKVRLLDTYEIKYYDMLGSRIEIKLETSSIRNYKLLDTLKKKPDYLQINGSKIKTFNVIANYILLCTNTFANIEGEFAKFKLRDLVDFYFFTSKKEIQDCWSEIIKYADKLDLLNQIKAVLLVVDMISENIFEEKLKKIDDIYDEYKYGFAYESGFLHNWDSIDLLLGLTQKRDYHLANLYLLDSVRAYSYKNINFSKPYSLTKDSPPIRIRSIENHKIEFYEDIEINLMEDSIKVDILLSPSNFQCKRYFMIYDINKSNPRTIFEMDFLGNNLLQSKIVKGDLKIEYLAVLKKDSIQLIIKTKNIKTFKDTDTLAFRTFYTIDIGEISYTIESVDSQNILNNPYVLKLDRGDE